MTVARGRLVAFALALAATWLVLLLWAAGIDPRVPLTPARTQALPGSRYHAVFGQATPDGGRLEVTAAAEDYSALQMTDVMELAAAELPDRTVLVVCHDAVIWLLRYVCESLTEDELMARVAEQSVRNASLTVLAADDGGPWRVERFDDVGHLAAQDEPVTEHPGQGDE